MPQRLAAALVALSVAGAIGVAAITAVLVLRLPGIPARGSAFLLENNVHVVERRNDEQRQQYATAAGLIVVALLGGAVAIALAARRGG